MSTKNDLEGQQDQGGKHGGQQGMPRPAPRPEGSKDQGVVRDERGQDQPRDKQRAQQVSRQDKGGDPPGQPPPADSRAVNDPGSLICSSPRGSRLASWMRANTSVRSPTVARMC